MTQAIMVLNYIQSNSEITTAKKIMAALGLSRAIADKILSKFFRNQIINKIKYGVYCKNSLTDTFTIKEKFCKHKAHPTSFKTEQEKLTYTTYCAMITRCYNKNSTNYKSYGAKGITICEEWLNDYNLFVAEMGLRPAKDWVIDRIDNERGYFKDNCRWVTQEASLKNVRHIKREKGNQAKTD